MKDESRQKRDMKQMRLECRNITFRYPGTDKPVLTDISFQLAEPGFHGLFGPSGVGKTSLAQIISGELKGFSGQIKHHGIHNLLYSYNLERLPGWSNVGSHLSKVSSSSRGQRKKELIEIFGLQTCLELRFSQLSLGQQNRINLLRYLLQDFQLLIMDESLANVDEKTRERILLAIKKMFPEVFFLYISHNVIEVSKFCKKVLVFREAHKSPQTLLVNGRDHKSDQDLDNGKLERTMLEIMYAL